ncbi:MAG: ATP-binding protein, partial [Bacteroidota bacterium]
KYTLLPWYQTEGEVGGMIMYTADITSEIVFQEELAQLNSKLETRVQEQTSHLRFLNKEMEQFVYIASHDLQEPLRAIVNYTDLLGEKERSEEDRFLIHRISAVGRRMQTLVKDLLDYSRTGREVERKELLLNPLVDTILADLDQIIAETGAQVEVGNLPSIHAAESDARQLFQNLIGNALKYQPPHAVPVVSVKAQNEGDKWVFSVSDNGIGIKPNHQARIFQIFQRLHTSEEFPGTGIGLAMCKKIVDKYGGRIWVDSVSGEGSTFSFTLEHA